MKITIIRGTDKKSLKKINEILAIYNGDGEKGVNTFDMKYPEKCFIVSVKGKAGGIIVETIFKGYAFIYYAAFASVDRRQGFLRACINEYNNLTTHKIIGVQVDLFDNLDVWHKQGFLKDNQVMFNWTPTYLNITPAELNRLMEKYPNNDDF